jgi:aspartyl-tRNA(Asn)/glutamyl-tRNA(Gln) amidotransferase subunit B
MPKIGLEIHGYIATEEKLFCDCKAIHGAKLTKPNTHICPICTGQPGAKPMLPNKKAIDKAIQIALILECKINPKFEWLRKHYDWPDLPKGYQNTISGTHATPVGEKGKLLGIRITECHLEEDPAAWNPKTGEIDYNKSGTPLIEIVTEPDFKDAEQVVSWLKQLTITLGYIKAIDKASGLKADVNISLPEKKGARVEIKNINSIKNIKRAIEYEITRQNKTGELPKSQETRMFNEAKGTTIKMRSKEVAQDYRFISDPDLPAITLKKERINKLKSALPETPQAKLDKLLKKYLVPKKYAEILSKRLDLAEFFEEVTSQKSVKPITAAQWITTELLRVLNANKAALDDENTDVKSSHFAELLGMLNDKTITEQQAKKTLRGWIPKSSSPKQQLKGSERITNKTELKKIVDKVLKQNKKAVEDYKAGKEASLNFLIGQVMRETKGRADNNLVRKLVIENI